MGLPSCNVVSFNDDMLVEIFTKLPLASFSRSKCVSKSFQTLLSQDYTLKKLPLIVSGVFQPSKSSLKDKPTYLSNSDAGFSPTRLDFFPFQHKSSLIDCCNGLLLFYSSIATAFYVCNPITKKYVSLPKPSKNTKLSILAFDPNHSQRFSVVNFTIWLDQGADIEIFDSRSWEWRERRVTWGINTGALSSIIRYIEGVLYIMAQPKQAVVIDLSDMSCRRIGLPEIVKRECCLGKFEGRLHYSSNEGDKLRIWMLNGDNEWVLKHCVCVEKMGGFKVLAMDLTRENVVYLWIKGKLVAYDVCEKRVKENWKLGDEEKGHLVQVWAFPFSKNIENCLE